MSHRLIAAALAAALLASGCRKSDAERAAAERAALRAELTSSYALVPYRFLKLAVRSEGSPGAPPELAAVGGELARIEELARRGDAKGDAEAVLRLAVLAYQTRSLLGRHDEDQFPLLWARFVDQPPPPWYDAGAEHLAIAFVEGLLQVLAARGGDKDTAFLAFAAYELSRAEPAPAWPTTARLVARLERGLLFCGSRRHYAADEELTTYLAELDQPSARALLAPVADVKDPFLFLRGAGRMVRGWNRLQLGREELGLADLDQGLVDLQGAGVENELTLWTWALVHAKRARPADAARALERLAESPHLDADARAEALTAASALRTSGRYPGPLAQGRAAVLIARALVARAGGVERLAATAVGPAAARRLVAPLTSFLELQERVARASDPKALAGRAEALGSSLLEKVKSAVGGAAKEEGARSP